MSSLNSSSYSSSSSLSSSLSSSSPGSSMTELLSVEAIQTLSPVETSIRVDGSESVADLSNPTEESSPRSGFDWVDSKVTGFTSVYRDSSSISAFVDKHNILKLDVDDGILAIDYWHPSNTVCIDRSPSETPFFFIYSYFSQIYM